jgi:hypothetical protein
MQSVFRRLVRPFIVLCVLVACVLIPTAVVQARAFSPAFQSAPTNFGAFTSAAVAGVPLVLLVLGLVELSKRLGLAGRWLTVASMAIGIVFGAAYMVSQDVPVDFGGWFAVIVYGLMLGLIASGVYDAFGSATAKN